MATITIETTDFESYLSVAETDDYMLARVGAATWDAATTEDKSKALVSATRLIDRKFWRGEKTSPAQVLQFPRIGLVCGGLDVPSDAVPERVETATAELALSLLSDAETFTKRDQGQGNTKRLKAGSAEIEFFTQTQSTASRTNGQPFPDHVMDLLACFLASASVGAAFVSGTENKTADQTGTYGLTKGY